MKPSSLLIAIALLLGYSSIAAAEANAYAQDDAHNHDGTHPPGAADCGTNYMLPGEVARLGSHSFIILGQDGDRHILAEHRSGTPPHTYQFILRVRLDDDEMAFYKKLRSESKLLPAFTTIYFDDTDSAKQLDRTFFCLQDLPQIFGDKKKSGDKFDKLFPIRASLQKDADFEGLFEIKKSIYPGGHFSLDRADVELVVYRYLPAYMNQKSLRKAIKERPKEILPLLDHAPTFATEDPSSAMKHSSYAKTDGALGNPGAFCPEDYYLKGVAPPETIHSFLLLAEVGDNKVLASYLSDEAPHNFTTIVEFQFSPDEIKLYRQAKAKAKTPPLLQTRVATKTGPKNFSFCMADLKTLVQKGTFRFGASLYRDSELSPYRLGDKVGVVKVEGSDIKVLTNRNLLSLLNPIAVAQDELGQVEYEKAISGGPPKGFVDLKTISPDIQVEMRYFSDWNFLGRKVIGYRANKCYLTEKAARALAQVQTEVSRHGYSVLVFDCYRPQRSVDEFLAWTSDLKDQKMKEFFYPSENKQDLVTKQYIASKSGHSRGSTVDVSLVKQGAFREAGETGRLQFQEKATDCRRTEGIETTGQLDMGTSYDCLDPRSTTLNSEISEAAQKNRLMLSAAMAKAGFANYPKEWWHYTLKDEPNKNIYHDFVVR